MTTTILTLNEGEPTPFALDADTAEFTKALWIQAKPAITDIVYSNNAIEITWATEPSEQDLIDLQALREGRYAVGANLEQ